mgnify:CR=1 FL=1
MNGCNIFPFCEIDNTTHTNTHINQSLTTPFHQMVMVLDFVSSIEECEWIIIQCFENVKKQSKTIIIIIEEKKSCFFVYGFLCNYPFENGKKNQSIKEEKKLTKLICLKFRIYSTNNNNNFDSFQLFIRIPHMMVFPTKYSFYINKIEKKKQNNYYQFNRFSGIIHPHPFASISIILHHIFNSLHHPHYPVIFSQI